jgi:hypothetical protein
MAGADLGAMAEGCGGVALLGLCLDVDPVFNGVALAMAPLFGFFMAALSGPLWRARLRRWLYGATWSEAYAGLLGGLTARLAWWFGPPWSWRAFDRCLALAFIYTTLLSVAAEVLRGGPGLPPAGIGAYVILAGAALLAAVLARSVMHLRPGWPLPTVTHAALAARSAPVARAVDALLTLLGLFAVFLAAGAIATLAEPGTILSQASATGAFCGTVAGALLAGGPRSALRLAALLAALSTLALMLGWYHGRAAWGPLLLLVGLPLVNAAMDWPSWAISRWLMARLRRDAAQPGLGHRAGLLLGHAVLDLALAVLCMLALAVSIAALAHGADESGVWTDYSPAVSSPFSGLGAVMTVMLASTLVPTALHLFFALFAMAVLRPPFAAVAAGRIEEQAEAAEPATRLLVALYLTACAGFALVVMWAAGRLVLVMLDALSGPGGLWAAIFSNADALVEMLGLAPNP